MAYSRLIKLLVAFFGVLTGIVLVVLLLHRPHPKTPFQHLTNTAQQVTIRTSAAHVRLYRDGNSWTVSADSGSLTYPADKTKVSSMLEALDELQIEDEISDRIDRAAEFEVDEQKGLDVTLLGNGGTHLAEAIFGKQAPDFAHIYVRFPGNPEVYLGRGVILGELGGTELNGWRSHELWAVPETQVQAIFIEGPGLKTPLVRSSDTWSSNGTAIDAGKAFSLVGVLAHLRADDFVNSAQNPNLTPDKLTYATITIQTSTGNHILHIGRMDKITQRYPAAVDSSPDLVWLNKPSAESLLKKVSDFK